jgi:hypothetical protein
MVSFWRLAVASPLPTAPSQPSLFFFHTLDYTLDASTMRIRLQRIGWTDIFNGMWLPIKFFIALVKQVVSGKRPVLKGSIEQVYVNAYSPEQLQRGSRCDLEVFVKATVLNVSDFPTTTRSFGLTVHDADGMHESEYLGEADKWRMELGNPIQDRFGHVIGTKYERMSDLGADTATAPLTLGVQREGWLRFKIVNANPRTVERGMFRLTAVDSFGTKHEIAPPSHPLLGSGVLSKYLHDQAG